MKKFLETLKGESLIFTVVGWEEKIRVARGYTQAWGERDSTTECWMMIPSDYLDERFYLEGQVSCLSLTHPPSSVPLK